MTLPGLILRYASFAVLASLANLMMQRAVFTFGVGPVVFVAALFFGTLVSLVLKYLLDKRWIFADASTGVKAHGRKLTMYTALGIITTIISWGTETAFWLTWQTVTMREIGLILGLTVGYTVKYNLDRRFVFTDRRREPIS